MNESDNKRIQKILDGIKIAIEVTRAGEPSVYDLNKNEVVTVEEALENCRNIKERNPQSDCIVDTPHVLTGSKKEIDRELPLLDLQRFYNKGIGPFLILNSHAFTELLLRLDPESIISLCNTNIQFKEKCQKTKIYDILLNKIFPKAQRSNKYESSSALFERMWRTRVLLEDFQSLTRDDFDMHPEDVIFIFDRFIKAVDTVKEYEGWDTIDLTSKPSAIQMIQLLQYPRWQILEKSDFDPNVAKFYANIANAKSTSKVLTAIYEEDGTIVTPKHIERGMSHEEYLELLRPLAPENNMRKNDWLNEFNENILDEIERLTLIAEKKSDPETFKSLENLKIILAIEIEEPDYLWTLNPTMDLLQEENIPAVWDMLLDWRAEYIIENDNETLTAMYLQWTEVKNAYENDGEENWYNADFNVVYTDEQVQTLIENEELAEDELDHDNRIFSDLQRWDELWYPAFEEIEESLE